MSKAPYLACSYASVCGGCELLLKPYAAQESLKIAELEKSWRGVFADEVKLPPVRWVAIDKGGLRDRMDMMIDRRAGTYKLGLFDKFLTGLVDLQGCPQLSPALEAWLQDFRALRLPIERGSARLRVAPDGRRGIWLDFANLDVKMLLEERETLQHLQNLAIVEIGQKRKRLVEIEGKLKLADPVLEAWFETYIPNARGEIERIPLYCTIGSFTQAGFRANRALVGEVHRLIERSGARSAVEFGSGIGNFTLPLAAACERVRVYEVDGLALTGLRRSADQAKLNDRLEINEGNFQIQRREPLDFGDVDLILVDPPRSGLRHFLEPLAALRPAARPATFIYVSCFADSFARDASQLRNLGYTLSEIAIVDQFPQSRHFEIVAAFSR